MSDRMMPLDEAREWVAQDKSTRSTARAARTVVAQAEQIERLQRAVNYAIKYSLQDAFDLVIDGVLHPGDMEPPA